MAVIHIGTAATLAEISQATINNGDIGYIWLNSYTRKMVYDSSSTKAEDTINHPYYVRPDDYDTGVWVESVGEDQPEAWAGAQIRTGDIASTNWVDGSSGVLLDLDNELIAFLDDTFSNQGIQLEWTGSVARAYIGDGSDAFLKFDGTKLTWKAANSELDASGNLTATSATISGEVTAETGTIGGWTLTANELHNSNIWLDAADKQIAINSQTFGNDGIQLEYNSGNPRAYIGDGSNAYLNFDGTKIIWKAANTELDASGNLVASSATLSGQVTAASGEIGGWTITNGYIYSLASGTPTSSPADGIVLASGNEALIVYEDADKRVELGYLSAGVYGIKGYDDSSNTIFELSDTQLLIGGWTLGTSSLTSTNIGLHSGANAEILLGHATTYASAKIGLKNDGSGKLADGNISWTAAGLLTATINDGGTITLDAGADIELTGNDATGDKAQIVFNNTMKMGAADEDELGIWCDNQTSTFYIGGEPYYSGGGYIWDSQQFGDIWLSAKDKNVIIAKDASVGYVSDQAVLAVERLSGASYSEMEAWAGATSFANFKVAVGVPGERFMFNIIDAIGSATPLTVKKTTITIPTGTDVGIGTASPGNPLAVNRSSDGVIVDFESADTVEGTISISGTTTSYNAFVGSHYTQLRVGQEEFPVGAVLISSGDLIPCSVKKETPVEVDVLEAVDIVEKANAYDTANVTVEDKSEITGHKKKYSFDLDKDEETEILKPVYKQKKIKSKQLRNGVKYHEDLRKFYKVKDGYEEQENNKFYRKDSTIQSTGKKEYFVYVETTTKKADKRVYGVWLGKMSDNAKGMSFGVDSDPVYLIAQVGLFKIRVTDLNGNISNGDYLETSERAMEAQKQTGKDRISSTIAKSMIDVNWDNIEEDAELGYKWKLIPCTF